MRDRFRFSITKIRGVKVAVGVGRRGVLARTATVWRDFLRQLLDCELLVPLLLNQICGKHETARWS